MRVRLSLVGAILALVAVPSIVLGASPVTRLATIDGASEVPAVVASGTGSGWVSISADESTIAYHVEYSGLSGVVVAAHIHSGAPGVAGGVILPLVAGPSPMNGTLTAAQFSASGSITTFAQAVAAIKAGQTYFNLHTAAHPAGELRGNLTIVGDTRLATIDGASEVPAVVASGTGSGWVSISADESTIAYHVEYSGLSGVVVAAHIHSGAPGVAGGVILPLVAGPSPMNGTLTAAQFSASGSITTFAQAVAAIKAGQTYFNLHTAAHPAGELRGNIGTAAPVPTPTPAPSARITPPPTSTVAGVPAEPDTNPVAVAILLLGLASLAAAWRRLATPRTR